MIVLPNSFERYLSSLRILVSLSILKYGLQARHLKNLKKIHSAEAFFSKENTQSVDIAKLCQNFLNAVKIINPHFVFRVFANHNRKTNKNLLSLLLLTTAQHTDRCYIYATENHIILKTTNITKYLSPFVKALGGYYLREVVTNQTAFIIPAPVTNNHSVYIESDWELIFDKFSLLNIFFNNILPN